MENEKKSLDEAIKAAQNSAKKGQTRFWILSISWVIVIIIVSIFSYNVLDNLDRTQLTIDSLSTQLKNTMVRLQNGEKEDSLQQKEISELQVRLFNQLNPETKRQTAIELANRNVERKYVSPGESKFLETQLNLVGNKGNARDLYLKGISYSNDNKYDSALTYLTKAIKIEPDMKDAYLARGRVYQYMDEYKNAINDFDQLIKLSPSSSVAYASRAFSYFGLTYIDDKDIYLKKALEDCKKAVSLDSTYWVPYHYRGFIYYRMGKKYFNYAELNWQKAAKLRVGLSGTAGCLENLGLIYLSSEQWQKALKNCLDVNDLYNSSSWNWLFLYITASKLGRKDLISKARKQWDSLKNDGDIKSLQRYLPESFRGYIN